MGNITNSINGRHSVNMRNRLIKNFDGEKVAQECVEWIRQYAKENNMRKVVLGISGGKDSTVAEKHSMDKSLIVKVPSDGL